LFICYGGTITNTANNANANAIRNGAAGTVTLSNTTVQANAHADAHAIRNVTTDTSRINIGSGVNILGRLLGCSLVSGVLYQNNKNAIMELL